jgi:hypothetical protein
VDGLFQKPLSRKKRTTLLCSIWNIPTISNIFIILVVFLKLSFKSLLLEFLSWTVKVRPLTSQTRLHLIWYYFLFRRDLGTPTGKGVLQTRRPRSIFLPLMACRAANGASSKQNVRTDSNGEIQLLEAIGRFEQSGELRQTAEYSALVTEVPNLI